MRAAAFAIAWMLVSAAPAPPVWALGDPAVPRARACDHTQELEAAKRALAAGDQAAAVEHLLRADAILAACQQEPAKADPGFEPETPERALVQRPGRGGSRGCG